jgi:hypothetical protein
MKDKILQAQDLTKEKVNVPEWGVELWVRCLTGTERDKFESDIVSGRGDNVKMNFHNMRSKLLVMTLVDESGERIFADKDTDALGKKNAAVLDRLFAIAQKLSGLRKEDVDELAKNLKATQDEGSNSD